MGCGSPPEGGFHRHSPPYYHMRFHADSSPERQRSSLSTAALGHSNRRTALFVYSSNAAYARGTLRHLLDDGLREHSVLSVPTGLRLTIY